MLLGRILPALLVASSIASAQTPTHDDRIVGLVPLDAGGTTPLYVDVYLPPGVGAAVPCVVWIHGGGWATGSHDGVPSAILRMLDSGVAVVSAGYRLSQEAIFPAQLHDVKGVVRHLRANAGTYHIDPNRIACWGASAGGHLAALLATTGDDPSLEGTSGGNTQFSSRVLACVDYFGPSDLLQIMPDVSSPPGCFLDYDAPDSYSSRLIGFDGPGQGIGVLRNNLSNTTAPFPEKLALLQVANPIMHLTPDDAPMFLAHGLVDSIVPTTQSVRLFDAARAVGLHPVLEIDPASGHGSLEPATYAQSRAFLLQQFWGGATPSGAAFCFGDGSGGTCPCGNTTGETEYVGCANSAGTGGGLRGDGTASTSADSLVLQAFGMTNSTALYVVAGSSANSGAGNAFSDGLLCLSGPVVRVGVKSNANGASSCPGPGEPSVATLSSGFPGSTRYFQVLYRDVFEYCKQTSYNLTNAVAVTYGP